MKMTLALAAAATIAGAAPGQDNTFNILVSNLISPDQPSATIELWADFDSSQYAFCLAALEFRASPDPGGFSDPQAILNDVSAQDGDVVPDGDTVIDIIPFQLHYPMGGGPHADTANPILVWRATWSTSDFEPRTIPLGTVTGEYDLYVDESGTWESFLDQFAEGSGTIQVVPAPAGALALAMFGLSATARGRWRSEAGR